MFIRHSIDHRMIDAMEIAAIFSVTSSMVRTADDEYRAPLFFPAGEQASQFPVHIAKRRCVAFQGVMGGPFQVKVVGIVDRRDIQIEKNFFLLFFPD